MEMKQQGFTLIELLAVIVILAIIVLIATPTILGVIEKSKKGASEQSALGYIDAVEKQIIVNELDSSSKDIEDGYYSISELTDLGVSVKGTLPDDGIITISGGKVTDYVLGIGNYVVINGETTKVSNTKKYENGYVVYYNPTTKEVCDDYQESNSSTGNKEGCMKWYVINDEEGNSTVNLILDHNTTDAVAWNSSYSNESGMDDILTAISNDTKEWQVTARPITANEVAKISNPYSWDSSESTSVNWFYFGSNTNDESQRSNYSWLYDRTYLSCVENYGCANNSDKYTIGYWTSTPCSGDSVNAWYVGMGGALKCDFVGDESYGVRPVIMISKNILN
jgi:type IV pilus assembly protein PilA